MSDSPQNILREAADRLIQTAEHLGRVASLSWANSTASSLPATSSVLAAASGNAISNISSTNSAPPIASSAASEHARLFGYRPLVAGNVRSRGTAVTEVELEVDQTLALRTISTTEASRGADHLLAWLTATKHIHLHQANRLC